MAGTSSANVTRFGFTVDQAAYHELGPTPAPIPGAPRGPRKRMTVRHLGAGRRAVRVAAIVRPHGALSTRRGSRDRPRDRPAAHRDTSE